MENDRMHIDRLRQEVLSGKITCDDVVRRLTQVIEHEYLKESPNVDFINTCEDFLWEMGTEGKQKYVTVSDRYIEAIEQHIDTTTQAPLRKTPVMGFAKRIALISAVFAILLCFTQGAIHLGWFTQRSSTDEQQYIIQGHEITISLIETCIAEHNKYDYIKTNNLNDLRSFLGFMPSIVTSQTFHVDTVLYEAYVEPGIIMVNVLYESEPGNAIAVLTIQYYTDTEEALFMFEQDAIGDKITLNGHTVYVSTNLDHHSYSWMSDSTVTLLTGIFDLEVGSSIVEQLIGGTIYE